MIDRLVRRLGMLGAFLTIVSGALVLLALVTWPVGLCVRHASATSALARFDAPIVRAVAAHRTAWLTSAMRGVSWLGTNAALAIVVVGVGVLARARRGSWGAFVLLAAAALGAAALETLLKDVVARPRPPLAWAEHETDHRSFPSGHAALTAVYLSLGYLLGRWRVRRAARALCWLGGVTLALLVGASRVVLGVHWPTDVLAGWAIAAIWVAVLLASLRAVSRAPAGQPARSS
jgi:undecaprenyl-diphosphatase